MIDEQDFVQWLSEQLKARGWNNSELARRVNVSPSNVHSFVTRKRKPTWDFCAGVAQAFALPPDTVFRKAGLLPAVSFAEEKEQEAVQILRSLESREREPVMRMLRGLVGQYIAVDSPSPEEQEILDILRSLEPAERARAVDVLRALVGRGGGTTTNLEGDE